MADEMMNMKDCHQRCNVLTLIVLVQAVVLMVGWMDSWISEGWQAFVGVTSLLVALYLWFMHGQKKAE